MAGVTAQAHVKREHLRVDAAYTWSRLQGNVTSGFGNEWLNNPAQDRLLNGYLPEDARHAARLMGVYSWRYGLSLGATYLFTSGAPKSFVEYNNVTVTPGDLLGQRGTGVVGRGSPASPSRLESVNAVGLQTRWNLHPTTGVPVEVWVDLLNVRNEHTTVVIDEYSSFGDLVAQSQAVKRIRLGLRAWF